VTEQGKPMHVFGEEPEVKKIVLHSIIYVKAVQNPLHAKVKTRKQHKLNINP